MFSHIDLLLSLCLRLRILPIFIGTDFHIATLLEIQLPQADVLALLDAIDIAVDLQYLLLKFIGAVIKDILRVIFDYKGLSFQYFIQHYFKTVELLHCLAVVIEDALARLGTRCFQDFDDAGGETEELSAVKGRSTSDHRCCGSA
jgi:hypothetical protein